MNLNEMLNECYALLMSEDSIRWESPILDKKMRFVHYKASNNLWIFKDRSLGAIYFIKAKTFTQAVQQLRDRFQREGW